MSNWRDALTALVSATERDREERTDTRIVRPSPEQAVAQATLSAAIGSQFTRTAHMQAKLNAVTHSRRRLRKRSNSNTERT